MFSLNTIGSLSEICLCGDVYMKPTANVPNNRVAQADEDEQSAPSVPVGYVPSYYPYYAYNQQMPAMGHYGVPVYYPQGYDPTQPSGRHAMMHYMQQYQLGMLHSSMIHQVSSANQQVNSDTSGTPEPLPSSPSVPVTSEHHEDSSSSESLNASTVRRKHLGITRDKSKWVLQKKPAAQEQRQPWSTPSRTKQLACTDSSLDLRTATTLSIGAVSVAGTCTFTPTGLRNPQHSKICYLNSICQVLLPVTALFTFLTHTTFSDPKQNWLRAVARIFGEFRSPAGPFNILSFAGVERLVGESFGLGQQHDTGEALTFLLERLHAESRWLLEGTIHPSRGPGLNEDSQIYRLFRGVFEVDAVLPSNERRHRDEMFLTLQLAPSKKTDTLVSLLSNTFIAATSTIGESKCISYLPPVLVVELSRHLTENKETMSQALVTFPGTLNIPESCLSKQCEGREYQLSGVIVRSGVYSNSGHYWVAQRHDSDWHWINDEEVTPIKTVTETVMRDRTGVIATQLDAATSWCMLVYIDQLATVEI